MTLLRVCKFEAEANEEVDLIAKLWVFFLIYFLNQQFITVTVDSSLMGRNLKEAIFKATNLSYYITAGLSIAFPRLGSATAHISVNQPQRGT